MPAFVSIKDGHCLPKQPCTSSDYDVVYGNISLYQALAFLSSDAAQNVTLLNQGYDNEPNHCAFAAVCLCRWQTSSGALPITPIGQAHAVALQTAQSLLTSMSTAKTRRVNAKSPTHRKPSSMTPTWTKRPAQWQTMNSPRASKIIRQAAPRFSPRHQVSFCAAQSRQRLRNHLASQINASTVTPASSACLMTINHCLRPHARPYPALKFRSLRPPSFQRPALLKGGSLVVIVWSIEQSVGITKVITAAITGRRTASAQEVAQGIAGIERTSRICSLLQRGARGNSLAWM